MIRVCVAALLLVGCGAPAGPGVEITIDGSQVAQAVRAQVNELALDVGGDETFFGHVAVSPLAAMERILYRTALANGHLRFTLYVHDVNSRVIACGLGETDVHDGRGKVTLTLTEGECPGPGGGDGGTVVSSCDTPGWLFCDGFDGANIDLGKWMINVDNNTTLTTDPQHFVRGSRAARFFFGAPASGPPAYETVKLYRPLLSDPAFVRFFVYLPSTTVTAVPHGLVLAALDDMFYGYTLAYDSAHLNVGFTPSGTPDSFDVSGGTLPLDQWACVEWQIPTGAKGDLHVWLNDAEVGALQQTGLTPPRVLGNIEVGSDDNISAGAPIEYWIDDFVMSNQKIGCTR